MYGPTVALLAGGPVVVGAKVVEVVEDAVELDEDIGWLVADVEVRVDVLEVVAVYHLLVR